MCQWSHVASLQFCPHGNNLVTFIYYMWKGRSGFLLSPGLLFQREKKLRARHHSELGSNSWAIIFSFKQSRSHLAIFFRHINIFYFLASVVIFFDYSNFNVSVKACSFIHSYALFVNLFLNIMQTPFYIKILN